MSTRADQEERDLLNRLFKLRMRKAQELLSEKTLSMKKQRAVVVEAGAPDTFMELHDVRSMIADKLLRNRGWVSMPAPQFGPQGKTLVPKPSLNERQIEIKRNHTRQRADRVVGTLERERQLVLDLTGVSPPRVVLVEQAI
jgi:hypothetical protein